MRHREYYSRSHYIQIIPSELCTINHMPRPGCHVQELLKSPAVRCCKANMMFTVRVKDYIHQCLEAITRWMVYPRLCLPQMYVKHKRHNSRVCRIQSIVYGVIPSFVQSKTLHTAVPVTHYQKTHLRVIPFHNTLLNTQRTKTYIYLHAHTNRQ